MARSDQNSRLVAFGGIMAALSLVLMLLTAVIPVMDYGLPALASILMVMVVIDSWSGQYFCLPKSIG